jgi:hypothetical protein
VVHAIINPNPTNKKKITKGMALHENTATELKSSKRKKCTLPPSTETAWRVAKSRKAMTSSVRKERAFFCVLISESLI